MFALNLKTTFALVVLLLIQFASGSTSAAPVAATTGQNPTGGINDVRWHNEDALVLISFDGLRWDYLERLRPPAFLRVAAEGIWAEGIIPPFPTKTFPSHYTLATGLWVDRHGLTGNRFFDPQRGPAGETYSLSDRAAVSDGSWYGGEPLWVTAERQGMVAASMFFVGSEADIGGVRPSWWQPYNGKVPNKTRVDQVLTWLSMPPATRPRMITLYFSHVDIVGHRHGPDSPELAQAVMQADWALERLLAGIDALPHGERVNLVLVSDHGMAPWPLEDVHRVDLSAIPDARFVATGPYATIAITGHDLARHRAIRDAVAAQLPARVPVYLRADVPPRLHYSATRRTGDLVIVPPLGATVFDAARPPRSGGFNHGWDPAYEAMHGIFLARGPRLAAGIRLPRIRNVDVYPLATELLGLRPAPHDGDLGVFKAVLTPIQ